MDLEQIYNFAKEKLETEGTGHDWLHALRVEKNAQAISPSELSPSEIEMIKASVWLHDTIDPKIASTHRVTITDIQELLEQAKANKKESQEIIEIIQNISYSKNLEEKRFLSSLGQIVQDADRLDALGAIGIARAFYYGGSKNHALYNDETARDIQKLTEANYREQESVLNHFYEKLLHLKNSMNTPMGKKIAIERTKFMEEYLTHFYQEIEIDEPAD